MKLRVMLPVLLTLLIVYSDKIVVQLYSNGARDTFVSLGNLNQFRAKCENLRNLGVEDCELSYRIPISNYLSDLEVFSIGLGVINGPSNWFCDKNGQFNKVYETGGSLKGDHTRGGVFLYQTVTVSRKSCDSEVVAIVPKTSAEFGKNGWKSGSLVFGSIQTVSSFKNMNDFMASYLRAMIALLVVLSVFAYRKSTLIQIPGESESLAYVSLLAIHFVSSSSLLEVMLPGAPWLGMPLLKASGSAGCIMMLASVLQAIDERFRRIFIDSVSASIGLVVFFFWTYNLFPGGAYIAVQSAIAVALFAAALSARTSLVFLFSLFFLSDLSAVHGILPGAPTNSASHFILLATVYGFFERIYFENLIVSKLYAKGKGDLESTWALDLVGKRYGIGRISFSELARENKIVSFLIEKGRMALLNETEVIPRITANVVTSRQPLVRVTQGSKLFGLLTERQINNSAKQGREFCVFPLIFQEKIVGTLNFSNYSPWVIGDPVYLRQIVSITEILSPKLAEVIYKRDLRSTALESTWIHEMENRFEQGREKSKIEFDDCLNAISKRLDAKVIISSANPSRSRFATFSSHNYSKEDATFLEQHTPEISEVLVTSPANLAYFGRNPVFINEVSRLYAVYASYLRELFERNMTRSLYVFPVVMSESGLPWGVVWVELVNRIGRNDSDLRDLAQLLSEAIVRMLKSHFASLSDQRLRDGIAELLPDYVLRKIENGEDPVEKDQGFILNIDITGSTSFSKSVGPELFSQFVEQTNLRIRKALEIHDFVSRMTIWDAFIFTLSRDESSSLDLLYIEQVVSDAIATAAIQFSAHEIGYRIVLHWGDITRDITSGSSKSWAIVGSALAESCKFESKLKRYKNRLFISQSAAERLSPSVQKGTVLTEEDLEGQEAA